MNMVNRSIEMKNPNTPVDRSISHRKNALGWGICQEANEPAKIITDERMSMAMEMPSTPTARWMLRGVNHCQESTKSIGALSPAARMSRYWSRT